MISLIVFTLIISQNHGQRPSCPGKQDDDFCEEIAEIWAVMEFCPNNPTQSVGGEKLVLRLDLLYEEVNTRNFSSKG